MLTEIYSGVEHYLSESEVIELRGVVSATTQEEPEDTDMVETPDDGLRRFEF